MQFATSPDAASHPQASPPNRPIWLIPHLGENHAALVPRILLVQKLQHLGRRLTNQFGDSPESSAMTTIEFREKKLREIQDLLEKLSSLESASFPPEIKDRLFGTYQRQIERLNAIMNSPAFERLCSGRH
jgi:hypothetical protein